MSVYTTEVRFICETEAGLIANTGYNDVDEVIDKSWKKIFKNFPIFDESYREGLCKKILNHYYTREIGAETVALWKFWLNQKMNEIMPYYNKLYISEQIKYDPLHEIDFTREITENTNGDKTGTSGTSTKDSATETTRGSSDNFLKGENTDTRTVNSERTVTGETENRQINTGTTTVQGSTNGQDLHSDAPQGSIENIADGTYLTDAHMTTNTTDNTTTVDTSIKNDGRSTEQNVLEETDKTSHVLNESTLTNTQGSRINEELGNSNTNYSENNVGIREYMEHITGKNSSSSYTKLIQDYRDSLLNLDMDIIFELRDLFMNIY